jgi:hypothetical protein
MAIAFVESLGTVATGTTATTTVISPSTKSVSVGDTIFVGLHFYSNVSVSSVVDDLGNTYALVTGADVFTYRAEQFLYRADVTTGGSITSITATHTSTADRAAGAAVYTGVGALVGSVTTGGGTGQTSPATILSSVTIPAGGMALMVIATPSAQMAPGSASGSPSTTIVEAYDCGYPTYETGTMDHALAASEVTGFDGTVTWTGTAHVAWVGAIFASSGAGRLKAYKGAAWVYASALTEGTGGRLKVYDGADWHYPVPTAADPTATGRMKGYDGAAWVLVRSVPVSGVVTGQDSFTDTVDTHLHDHTPETGGQWVWLWNDVNPSGVPRISSGGTLLGPDVADWEDMSSTYIHRMGSATVADGDVYLTVITSTANELFTAMAGVAIRVAWDEAYVLVVADGELALHRVTNAGWTQLGTASTGHADPVRMRLHAEGSSPTVLKARLWPSGESEPGTWDIETSDNTAANQMASGYVGVVTAGWGDLTNEATGTCEVDAFLATTG